MPKVSIIIPVYNVEKYLERCIKSILVQTFKNFELILINDGSQDCSAQICKKYADIDKRIIFINQNNYGVSKARNKGIEISSGEYINFLDADDWLDKDAIEYLYNIVVKYNADISCYKMKNYKNGEIKNYINEKEKISIYTSEDILRKQVEEGLFLHSSCNKLYNKKLIKEYENVFDTDISYAEDALFNYQIMRKCDRLAYSNLRKYNYFINEKSTVKNVSEKRLDILKAQKKMYYLFNEKYSKFYGQNIIKQYVHSSISIVSDIASERSVMEKKYILDKLKKCLKRDREILNDLKKIRIKDRIIFRLINISPTLIGIAYEIRYSIINLKKEITK